MKNVEAGKKSSKNASKENVNDLTKLPKYQLLEMLDRQEKLLKNRSAIEKLPDKGARINHVKKQIEDELERRATSHRNLCDVMAGLTLTASQINALEWTKNAEELRLEKLQEKNTESDENPFRILASHSGTVFSKKIIKTEEKSQSLITEKDIEEIYAAKLCDKIDKVAPTSRFLPHKTLNHAFDTKKSINQFKPQDLCAASTPPSRYGNVKIISLESSIKLQYEQAQHLKELQLKHATERLQDKTYTIGSSLPSGDKLKLYRNTTAVGSDSECDNDSDDETQEVEDECIDEDREGTVVFQVTD